MNHTTYGDYVDNILRKRQDIKWAEKLAKADLDYENLKDEITQVQIRLPTAEKKLTEARYQRRKHRDEDSRSKVRMCKADLLSEYISYRKCLKQQVECLRTYYKVDLEFLVNELKFFNKKISRNKGKAELFEDLDFKP